jgi:hypothetical protein
MAVFDINILENSGSASKELDSIMIVDVHLKPRTISKLYNPAHRNLGQSVILPLSYFFPSYVYHIVLTFRDNIIKLRAVSVHVSVQIAMRNSYSRC